APLPKCKRRSSNAGVTLRRMTGAARGLGSAFFALAQVVRYRVGEAYLLRIRLDSLDHSHERCHHTLDRVALTTRRRNSRGRLGHQHESLERLHEDAVHDADARRSWPKLLASGRIAEGAAGGNGVRRLDRYRSDWRSHTRDRVLREAWHGDA